MRFYLDFEATRFSCRIISIGCTSDSGETFHTLVKPPKKEKVDKFITDLTGITNEMLLNAPTADEAFNSFFSWVVSVNDEQLPEYYCYGDSDKLFIQRTVNYMKDIRAITFAIALKAQLIDYSVVVNNYFATKQIALKKVVALIENVDEVPQNHDALEDAEMLKTVVGNLYDKCLPVDKDKLLTMPSARKNIKKAPDIFVAWSNGKVNKFEVDTLADENHYAIKCDTGKNVKYFRDIEVATLWAIKFLTTGKSPKKIKDVNDIQNGISNAIKNKNRFYGVKWLAFNSV